MDCTNIPDLAPIVIGAGGGTGRDQGDVLISAAAICMKHHVACSFAFDGRSLYSTGQISLVKQLDAMGQIIIIEPSTDLQATMHTPSNFLAIAESSANRIQQIIKKRPTFVRIGDKALTKGQLEILQRNDFIPIYASESSNFWYTEPSMMLPMVLARHLEKLNQSGRHAVDLPDCTGYSAYVTIKEQLPY